MLTKIPRVTEGQISSLRNFFLKESQLNDIRVSDETFEKGMKIELGLCSRLAYASRAMIIGHEILEAKYQSQMKRLQKALKTTETQCPSDIAKQLVMNNDIPKLSDEDLFEFSKTIQVDTAEGEQQVTLKDIKNNKKIRDQLLYQFLMIYS